MISVKFFLHTYVGKKKKKGVSSLYVRVHADGMYDLPASTHERIKRENWSHSTQKVKQGQPYADDINDRLKGIAAKIQKEFRKKLDNGEELTVAMLQEIIRPSKNLESVHKKKSKRPVINGILKGSPEQVYLDWKANYLAEKNHGRENNLITETSYTRRHIQTIEWLKKYDPKLKVVDLTPERVRDYRSWLMGQKSRTGKAVQDVTVDKHIRTIRVLLGHIGGAKDAIKTVKVPKATKYSLFWEDIIKLRDTEYKDELTRKAAHAFVIDCQLCLRYQDWRKVNKISMLHVRSLKHGDLRVINLNQGKTGDPVYIPAPPTAAALLQKYDWQFPWVFSEEPSENETNLFNETIKMAAKEAGLTRLVRSTEVRNSVVEEEFIPLHEAISSHDCRHTGKTLMRQATKKKDLADALLGHADNDTYDHTDPIILVDDLLSGWEIIEGC